LELVARWEAADQIPRALALYGALGQLHVSETPAQEVARLWHADPQSAIVVRTWEEAAAVRQAIAGEQATQSARNEPAAELQPASAPAPQSESAVQLQPARDTMAGDVETRTPVVLIAEAAYRSRIDAERAGEPALAPERAYVLAELDDRDLLTRALSVAMESHLVTAPPDQLTADLQAIHAREIAASLAALEAEVTSGADANRDRPGARSLELAIETALQAEAQRQAELEAERGDHEATPGGSGR
jgi:hypothetical protein